jgi:hypothetical protein
MIPCGHQLRASGVARNGSKANGESRLAVECTAVRYRRDYTSTAGTEYRVYTRVYVALYPSVDR